MTIPVLSMLVSDEMEALQTFTRDVEAEYPIIFGASANVVIEAVEEANNDNEEITE